MTTTTSRRPVVSLPTETQILLTRRFDVPRRLVFRAWTEPEQVKRWWTAGRGDPTLVEIDLRVGGTWRYLMTFPDGERLAFHGEYRIVVPSERLVWTEIGEQPPALTVVKTLTLDDAPLADRPGTTLALLTEFTTREERDAYVGMMGDGFEQASRLLEACARELEAAEAAGS